MLHENSLQESFPQAKTSPPDNSTLTTIQIPASEDITMAPTTRSRARVLTPEETNSPKPPRSTTSAKATPKRTPAKTPTKAGAGRGLLATPSARIATEEVQTPPTIQGLPITATEEIKKAYNQDIETPTKEKPSSATVDTTIETSIDAGAATTTTGETTTTTTTATSTSKIHKKFDDDDEGEPELLVQATVAQAAEQPQDDSDSDSDDEAPEAISADAGRKEAEETRLRIEAAEKSLQENRRNKRKALDAKLKSQASTSKSKRQRLVTPPSDVDVPTSPTLTNEPLTTSKSKLLPTSLLESIAGKFSDAEDSDSDSDTPQNKRHKKFSDSEDSENEEENIDKIPAVELQAKKRTLVVRKGPLKVKVLDNDKKSRTILPPKAVKRVAGVKEKWIKGRTAERRGGAGAMRR